LEIDEAADIPPAGRLDLPDAQRQSAIFILNPRKDYNPFLLPKSIIKKISLNGPLDYKAHLF